MMPGISSGASLSPQSIILLWGRAAGLGRLPSRRTVHAMLGSVAFVFRHKKAEASAAAFSTLTAGKLTAAKRRSDQRAE